MKALSSKPEVPISAKSYGLKSLSLFFLIHTITCWYLFSHLDFSRAAAIERLSKRGWVFSHFPPEDTSVTENFLSKLVPDHYVKPIKAAKLPTNFPGDLIQDSEADLLLLRQIEIFVLVGGRISEGDLESISKLNIAGELCLQFSEFESDETRIGDALGQLQQVRAIYFGGEKLNGRLIKGLGRAPFLSELVLENSELTAEEIVHLLDFPALERVNVRVSLNELIEAVRGKAKILIPKTYREHREIAGPKYLGIRCLKLIRRDLPDIVVSGY